jgi:CRISPR-associated endonuclease/helicase Cas3
MSINLKSHPDKSLKNHLLNVGKSSEKLINLKELNLTIISKNDLLNLSYLIGISHDFGKATSYFQDKMNNVRNSPFSHHGLISALFGYLLLKLSSKSIMEI